jgi:hypothetical protein
MDPEHDAQMKMLRTRVSQMYAADLHAWGESAQRLGEAVLLLDPHCAALERLALSLALDMDEKIGTLCMVLVAKDAIAQDPASDEWVTGQVREDVTDPWLDEITPQLDTYLWGTAEHFLGRHTVNLN